MRRLNDIMKKGKLKCYVHVRREEGQTGQRMLDMELLDRRARGRSRRRFVDAVKEDMKVARVSEEDILNRSKWR